MRRWRLGLPQEPCPHVGGRPCRYWLDLFLLTHGRAEGGWQRLEWPDGGPLFEQPWSRVRCLRIVQEELDAAERQEAARHRHP